MGVFAGGFLLRDGDLMIDDVSYANQWTKARLVPDTPTASLRTADPTGTIVDNDSTVWKFQITGVMSKTQTGSLADALTQASGTPTTATFIPAKGTGNTQATFTFIPAPVDFGGDQGSINTWDAEFQVVGQPTFAAVSGS